jgi:homoserine dehydrogenase
VGAATARLLLEDADELARRAGAPIELGLVGVRDVSRRRDVALPAGLLTDDTHALVTDPAIDIVVEVMGGIEPALNLLIEAAGNKKHIVTANKELLATLGREVLGAAETAGVDLLFEASVAGGIPIIRPLKESLAGDRIRRVLGIVNGTTNFILTRMSETGESFAEALGEAGTLGYTELDPSSDIEGFDSASKLAILSSIAFNARVVAGDVQREGITQITSADMQAAHELGYEIKLLAVAEQEDGQVSARVHPAMIPRTHPLASVRDVFNAVFIEGEHVGELMFLGRGAGGDPTASAVVGDIVEIARNMQTGARSVGCTCYHSDARIRSSSEMRVRYYVVLSVLDQPGVLAAVAGVFSKHGISIASVRQEGFASEATLVLITHSGTEGCHSKIFSELESLAVVKAVTSRIRVIGTAEG